MTAFIIDDVRRIVLGLLFVVAFGWMTALIFPGGDAYAGNVWQQTTLAGDIVPPLE